VISSYQPFPEAVRVSESSGIEFRNMHVDSNSKVSFDNSVLDSSDHAEVRAREFAVLEAPGEMSTAAAPAAASVVLAPHAEVGKLADGFFSISGGAVDAAGTLYFVDTHWQRIYRWNAEQREAEVVSSGSLEPENLAFDRAGDLLVISRSGAGTVYTVRPDGPAGEIKMMEQQPAAERSGANEYLPAGVFELHQFSSPRAWQYVATDGSAYISAGDEFVQGHMEWGTKMADLLRTFGLQKAVPGKPFYVTTENAERTFKGKVTATGSVTDLTLFTETGGESVVQDERGRVYVAAGQILVYSPEGMMIERIDVPERPLDLVFGGADRRTLYILTHHALYAVSVQSAGL
jgi:sugar lactone lactonase YvrE